MKTIGRRSKTASFFSALVCGLFFASAGQAQQIFTDFSRNIYRQLLNDALQALNRGDDFAALNHARNATSNMQNVYDKYVTEAARENKVQPGYEPRLNAFIGDMAGFRRSLNPERSDRDGREAGAAATAVSFTPNQANPNDYVDVVILFGLPEKFVEMIRSNVQSTNNGTRTINGVSFQQMNQTGHVEQGYMRIIDDRILVAAVSNRLDWSASALEVLDVNGLRAFSQ